MQTLFIFTDILKSLARIESQIENLGQSYSQVQERTAIDEALISQFQAKATELNTAAAALLAVTYDPDEPDPV